MHFFKDSKDKKYHAMDDAQDAHKNETFLRLVTVEKVLFTMQQALVTNGACHQSLKLHSLVTYSVQRQFCLACSKQTQNATSVI